MSRVSLIFPLAYALIVSFYQKIFIFCFILQIYIYFIKDICEIMCELYVPIFIHMYTDLFEIGRKKLRGKKIISFSLKQEYPSLSPSRWLLLLSFTFIRRLLFTFILCFVTNLCILLTFKNLSEIFAKQKCIVLHVNRMREYTCCVIDACTDNRNNRQPTGPHAGFHPASSTAPQFPPTRTRSHAWRFAESPRSPCK